MISPSELLVQATNLPLKGGIPATEDGNCAMCGQSHRKGQLVQPFRPAASFSDLSSLAYKGSKTVCQACIAIWTLDFTQRYAKSVVCSEGLFPAASNDHIAHWLFNPAHPPFLFYLSDQKQQHLAWRAPVNLNRKIFFVRYGFKIFTIRLQHLIDATEACKVLATAISDARRASGKKGAPVRSPFVSLPRSSDSLTNGTIREDVMRLAQQVPPLMEKVDIILACTPGEIWALSAAIYAKAPHQPQPSM